MSHKDGPQRNYKADISGGVSGQFSQGDGNTQISYADSKRPQVTDADLLQLRDAIAALRAQVMVEAPSEKKEAALERVQILEEAIDPKGPDLDAMGGVKSWFIKTLPKLAGVVSGIFIHPIVGKIVEAAGDGVAAEFRHRFGIEQ